MGADLVEASSFWGGFHQADWTVFGVRTGAESFEFGEGGISAGNHRLPDIDSAGLVFPQAVEGFIDDSGSGCPAVNDGEVGFMDFPALLHLSQKRGGFLSASHQKKARGFTVEPADQGQEFAGELLAEPIDQGEGSIGARGVDEPSGGFVDDEKAGISAEDGR